MNHTVLSSSFIITHENHIWVDPLWVETRIQSVASKQVKKKLVVLWEARLYHVTCKIQVSCILFNTWKYTNATQISSLSNVCHHTQEILTLFCVIYEPSIFSWQSDYSTKDTMHVVIKKICSKGMLVAHLDLKFGKLK